jgi:murein DD-endopeptidase MepM/ murein hydrolase activator NlpD
LATRNYTISASVDESLYVQRSGWHLFRSLIPDFFYTHPAFERIYPYASSPALRITGLDDPFQPVIDQKEWLYQRWDGSWMDIMTEKDPSGDPDITNLSVETLPVITDSNMPLRLNLEPYPDQVVLQVTDPAGRLRYDGMLEEPDLPLFPYNGRHEYHLDFSWTDEQQPYRGSSSSSFSLEMDLSPAFEVPGPNAVQGEMLIFRARHIPEGAVPVFQHSLSDHTIFFPLEDGYAAYIPTHYGTAPGEYALYFGLEGGPLEEASLTLVPRDFHIQYLTISTAVEAATRNEEAAAMTARYFTPSRDHSSPERYYTEPFVIPVLGRLTTEFGETRYVNNAPTSYRHSGLDIAAPTGTPVAATNRGKVVLAMDLITQGKTVVIDHGQGLFSVYFHMDELKTTANRIVERGEVIGTVGTTGFSTGPHLHFTMSYYRHNLEPGHFLAGEPITYQNAAHYLSSPD